MGGSRTLLLILGVLLMVQLSLGYKHKLLVKKDHRQQFFIENFGFVANAACNLQKLQLFHQFYLIVVSYIYFTCIIVYLLDATLPYRLEFLGDICTEGATLAFFCVVGHKFRPMKGNPYFNLEEEDAAQSEEMHASEDF